MFVFYLWLKNQNFKQTILYCFITLSLLVIFVCTVFNNQSGSSNLNICSCVNKLMEVFYCLFSLSKSDNYVDIIYFDFEIIRAICAFQDRVPPPSFCYRLSIQQDHMVPLSRQTESPLYRPPVLQTLREILQVQHSKLAENSFTTHA